MGGTMHPQISRYRVLSGQATGLGLINVICPRYPGSGCIYISTSRCVVDLQHSGLATSPSIPPPTAEFSRTVAAMSVEKFNDTIEPASSSDNVSIQKVDVENDGEIFKRGEGYEDFRTVGWIQTTIIFTKSMSSLSIDTALSSNIHVS